MPNYELTYILRPLEEAGLTTNNERINTIVTNAGGEIVSRSDWGRRRLAYPIRKVNDGYYTTLYVTLPGAAVRNVERRSLQLNDDVQRYLVVKVDEFRLPSAPASDAPMAAADVPGTTPPQRGSRPRRCGSQRTCKCRERSAARAAEQPARYGERSGNRFRRSRHQRYPRQLKGLSMARGLNKVMVIDNLGRDPEMRYAQRQARNHLQRRCFAGYVKPEGERTQVTDWFSVVASGRLAEICNQYLKPGFDRLCEGSLRGH